MMKRVLVPMLAVLLVAGSADAKDMKGKFGVGFDQTLAGVSGLTISYWLAQHLGTDITFGLGVGSWTSGSGQASSDQTPFELNFAVGIRYNIARSQLANMSLGLRFSGAYLNKDANPVTDNQGQTQGTFHPAIEIPITVEFFFTDHFAIRLQAGILFDLVPNTGRALTPEGKFVNGGGTAYQPAAQNNDDSDVGLGFGFGSGGLLGSGGFCFYF